jgi:uroporphyrinogen III methyltransferase/synthase
MTLPLDGLRIVITRARESAAPFARELALLGAEPVILPCIEFRPPEDPGPFNRLLGNIDRYDYLVLTSPEALRRVIAGMEALNIPIELAGGTRVLAVGSVTAGLARKAGFNVFFNASGTGRELVSGFAEKGEESDIYGKGAILPRSDIAPPAVTDGLRGLGLHVEDAVAYRTCPPASLDESVIAKLAARGADVLTFMSPSAVRNFSSLVPDEILEKLRTTAEAAVIGSVTRAAAEECGFNVSIEASERSAAGITGALVEHRKAAR